MVGHLSGGDRVLRSLGLEQPDFKLFMQGLWKCERHMHAKQGSRYPLGVLGYRSELGKTRRIQGNPEA